MANFNRTCTYCGDRYYVCNRCVSIGSWKNYTCSATCYRNMMAHGINPDPKVLKIGVNKVVVLRAGLIGGKTINIVGYDLELGRFDCSDGVTRMYGEFEYFIVPRDEMQSLGQRLSKLLEEAKENAQPAKAKVEAKAQTTEDEIGEVKEAQSDTGNKTANRGKGGRNYKG